MKPFLTFSKSAVKYLKRNVKKTNSESIFIGIKGGGCNGFKYNIEPTNEPKGKLDEELNIDGLNVIVCGNSLMYLIGTNVLLKEDFMGTRLDFDNPNAMSSCGCGETFSIDK